MSQCSIVDATNDDMSAKPVVIAFTDIVTSAASENASHWLHVHQKDYSEPSWLRS